jgi:hypothetical protein
MIKEEISRMVEAGTTAHFMSRNKLPAGDRERNRNDYDEQDFAIVQAALQQANSGATLIKVMDANGNPTPEFMEKVQGKTAGEKDYIDFGKDDEGNLYFKRVNAESPEDPTGYGFVSAAPGEPRQPYRPKLGQFG